MFCKKYRKLAIKVYVDITETIFSNRYGVINTFGDKSFKANKNNTIFSDFSTVRN